MDPNVVSEMMRQRPEPRITDFLDSIADTGLGLVSASVWEVLNGISRPAHGRRRRRLVGRFHDLVDELFEDRIVCRILAEAQACAKIMQYTRLRGEPLNDQVPDAILAAAEFTRGRVVVTRNTGEFRKTGVEAADPWLDGQG